MPNAKPSLKDVQAYLQAAVTSVDQTTPEAADLIELTDTGPTTTERLAVYANGWYLRLEECLREDYPKLASQLGDTLWEDLVHAYIRRHPSTTYDINRVGDALPAFFVETNPEMKDSWMGELALLELEISKIRGVADTQVWNVEELQTLSMDEAEALRFEIVPGVRLLDFDWNVDDIKWADAQPVKAPRPVVLYRDNYAPTYENVSTDESQFLKFIREKPLLTDLIQEFDGTAWMQWLASFAARGVLRRVDEESS